MSDPASPPTSKSAAIRSEFDKILMRHISGLIDTREDIAALPFNLATIASLLLLAERENEIKSFPESPPERYNRETFFSDIEEIGLELDADLMEAIRNLENYGFVVINADARYMVRESASLLILLLDSIFPQMPGMNLVAYVSQSIEEVVSGRKDQEAALTQFDQTLDNQGVRLSAIPENRLAAAQPTLAPEAPDPEMLKERRSAYLQKLKALRARSLSSEGSPTVVVGGASPKHFKIKELFPKSAPAPEPAIPLSETVPDSTAPHETPEPAAGISEQALPGEPPEDKTPPPAMEEVPPDTTPAPPGETETTLAEPVEGDEAHLQPQSEASEALSAGDAAVGEFQAPAPEIPEPAPEPIVAPEADPESLLSKEDLIEQRIKRFEEDLAMPCPICGNGKVLSDTTEKGKTYYHCSNGQCRLISWGKPYPMECPVCKNPFLVEVPEPDGQVGLKCPRATCNFRKKAASGILSGEESLQRKKVAVVKKRRRKGVRRVVRRKS